MAPDNQKPVHPSLKEFRNYLRGGHKPWTLVESRDDEGYLQLSTFILDAEMDPYKVTFGCDKDVTIDTDGSSYIILDAGQLGMLAEMAENAAAMICAELDKLRE